MEPTYKLTLQWYDMINGHTRRTASIESINGLSVCPCWSSPAPCSDVLGSSSINLVRIGLLVSSYVSQPLFTIPPIPFSV